MDMNGWHLYLRDITAGKGLKLHQALAQQVPSLSQTAFRWLSMRSRRSLLAEDYRANGVYIDL